MAAYGTRMDENDDAMDAIGLYLSLDPAPSLDEMFGSADDPSFPEVLSRHGNLGILGLADRLLVDGVPLLSHTMKIDRIVMDELGRDALANWKDPVDRREMLLDFRARLHGIPVVGGLTSVISTGASVMAIDLEVTGRIQLYIGSGFPSIQIGMDLSVEDAEKLMNDLRVILRRRRRMATVKAKANG